MNLKTKTDQTAADMNIGQVGQEAMPPVTVSMKKLTAGVTTLFMGIVQMLEALEPHMAQRLVDIAVQNSGDTSGYGVENESVDSGKEGQNVEAETVDKETSFSSIWPGVDRTARPRIPEHFAYHNRGSLRDIPV